MTNLRVRALGPVDRGRAASLFCDAFPLRALEVQSWQEPPSTTSPRRYVTRPGRSDEVIAYSALWWFWPDGKRMDLVVAPDWRRRGVGSELLAELVREAAGDGAITLQARADDGWTASLTFLQAHGFIETMRMHRQELRVTEATIDQHRQVEARLASQGIIITTLEREEASEPACWTRLRDLRHAARQGWVSPDPRPAREPELESPDEFRRDYQRASASFGDRSDGCFLAVQGDQYVGFTCAIGTAVRPDFRGRGVATALKVRAVAYARDNGVSTMSTSSASPAMLHINELLGFRRTSTEIRLVKPLTANA